VGPTCQTPRAAPGPCSSAPLPRACHWLRCRPRLKDAVGTARRASRQTASPRARCRPPDSASRAVVARPPRPSTPRRRPRAGEPPFLGRLPCTGTMPPPARRAAPPPCVVRCASRPSWAAHAGRASAASTGRALRGRGPRPRCATEPSVVLAQWHPVKFLYFLIYSIHCKFKNLCRIHLNS
jgi:hypothetical protein